MKSFARVVHLPSVVQYELYEAMRILFVRKENKNNFFQQIVSSRSPRHRGAILDITHRTQAAYRVNARMRYCYSNQSVNTHRICILALRRIQKSIRCLRSMGNAFLNLDSVIYLAVNGTDKTPGFYLKYLKLCSENKQSFYWVGTTCG